MVSENKLTGTSAELAAVAPERPRSDNRPAGRVAGRAALVLLLVMAAWALVVAARAVHAAIVLPFALLVSVAAVLRGGQTLLDRLMLAMGLLTGLTCSGALVFAIWPWGLRPVAVAGVAFTVLIVVAGLTNRRPTLPRPRVGDVLSLAGAAAVAALVAGPLPIRGHHPPNLMLAGEDSARHVSIFDAIQHTGGYLFQHWDAARQQVYPGLITYPQGSHMIDAVLDGFLRSGSPTPAGGTSLLEHYIGFSIGWYAFLALSMCWAAQWLAGGSLTLGRRIALVATIAGCCAATELFTLLTLGYLSEAAGLAEVVLLVAVLARPVPRPRQQLVTMASLLVAVGFTYYLFLPAALLATAVWLLAHRRQVVRLPITLLTCAAVGAGTAVVPPVLGLTVGHQGGAILLAGLQPPYRLLVVLGGGVLAGLLSRRARGSGVWRSYRWSALSVVAATLLFTVAQRSAGSAIGYYATKSLHLVIAVLIVGLGSVTLYLPSLGRPRMPLGRTLASAAAGVLVAVLALAGLGMLRGDRPGQRPVDTVWARGYRLSAGSIVAADAIRTEYDRQAGGEPVPTIMLDDSGYQSYLRTLFLGAMERTSGTLAPGFYNGDPVDSPTGLSTW